MNKPASIYYGIYKLLNSEFPGLLTGLPIGLFVTVFYGPFNHWFLLALILILLGFFFNWQCIRLRNEIKIKFDWQLQNSGEGTIGRRERADLLVKAMGIFSAKKRLKVKFIAYPLLWAIFLLVSFLFIYLGNQANTLAASNESSVNRRYLDTLHSENKKDEAHIVKLLIDSTKLVDSIKDLNKTLVVNHHHIEHNSSKQTKLSKAAH